MECFHPRLIKNPKKIRFPTDYGSIRVPCGKCPACLKRKQNQWAFRILHESENYPDRSYFVTLTYDDEHLPFSPSGIATLDKKDIHSFLHDFRQNLERSNLGKFRYFLCGEYGDKFGRPHYHAIIFTDTYFEYSELQDIINKSWHRCIKSEIVIGSLTPKSAQYCAKYSLKRFGIDYLDCQPPFCQVSKKPFLGSSYLSNDKVRQLKHNKQFHDFISGTPYALPRIYQDRVFSANQKYLHSIQVSNLIEKQNKYLLHFIYNDNLKDFNLHRFSDRLSYEDQLLNSLLK